jgi:hypothetical protein
VESKRQRLDDTQVLIPVEYCMCADFHPSFLTLAWNQTESKTQAMGYPTILPTFQLKDSIGRNQEFLPYQMDVQYRELKGVKSRKNYTPSNWFFDCLFKR